MQLDTTHMKVRRCAILQTQWVIVGEGRSLPSIRWQSFGVEGVDGDLTLAKGRSPKRVTISAARPTGRPMTSSHLESRHPEGWYRPRDGKGVDNGLMVMVGILADGKKIKLRYRFELETAWHGDGWCLRRWSVTTLRTEGETVIVRRKGCDPAFGGGGGSAFDRI